MADKRLKCGKLFRSTFQLPKDVAERAKAINVEARTVSLSFSSETGVSRWFGQEILDHTPKSVRLGRLRNSGAVLVDHTTRDLVGVVESAEISADRIGRAVVRFGKSARASEIFQDVQDGIRPHISVGYAIHDMVLEKSGDDGDTYRATDWEPYEVSFVPVPADTSVGVGRTADDELAGHEIVVRGLPIQKTRAPEMTPEEQAAADKAERERLQREAGSNAVAAERLRVKEIEAMGEQFKDVEGTRDLAAAAIDSGKSSAEFQRELVQHLAKKKPVPSADLGLSRQEIKRFSWMRALRALAFAKSDNAAQFVAEASYERELSAAASKAAGVTPKGLMVPTDVLRAPLMQEGQGSTMETLVRMLASIGRRDLTVGLATGGGHLVATDLLMASFIELLRNRMVLQRAGMTVLNGLVGNIAIPRQTGGATAFWVAESGNPTESQQAFDQVTMTPKTVGAFTDYSRRLLLQTSLDVENFIRLDLAKIIGLELDRVGLYGSGAANQPLGIKNVSGINTVDFAANAPTWPEIVNLETQVAADNADVGTLAYIINATGRGGLKTTEKAASTGIFIWEPGNTVNGYRTEVSNQVAANDFLFGNWADLLLGMWSGLDLLVDPFTGSTSGTVRVVALQDVDFAVRHPESFCRGNNTL